MAIDEQQDLTYGQKLVGVDFNPSGDSDVALVKGLYARIIDQCVTRRETDLAQGIDSEDHTRMYSTAITEALTACMWAVKAMTYRD
jgi:hypothetical protein